MTSERSVVGLAEPLTGWRASESGLRFGLFLGQAGKGWPQILEEFLLADELGYDHAWLVDHLVNTDGPPTSPCMEAWTLLAALAVQTRRVRLGVLVCSNTFRHPSLLLKEAATVDQLSGGRLILGLGTGWYEDEHRRYGLKLPPPPERVDRLEETAQIAHLLMSQERSTFHGRFYQLEDAPLEPKPVQRPRVPILIAAHRPRMLRLAARYADMWDTFPARAGTATEGVTDDIEVRVAAIDRECERLGRDRHDLRRSTWTGPDVLISEDRFTEFVETHVALGFTDFMTGIPAPTERARLERIARDVIPHLRTRTVERPRSRQVS
jgi:alkanesulfonate monooxygenase SsuD/methylene tetrahydromethanopterin reductase-like flavin-dependent oxidoreductase (luciferase family)